MYLKKRLIVASSAILLWGGLGSALAQGGKIGFVNSNEVLQGTEEGKSGLEGLNVLTQQKQVQFDGKSAELKELQDKLAAQRATLNADARSQLEAQIAQKQREIQRFQEDAQAEISQRQNELLQRMSEKVQVIIDEFAKSNSYLAIFMRDQSQAYVDPALDITAEIIRLYNERNPVATSGTSVGQ